MSLLRRLHLPMRAPADVIPHLVAEHHYKEGRSARLIAESWVSANDLPVMIKYVLDQHPRLSGAELVDAFLERCTDLGDGLTPSQSDVLAILGLRGDLAVMAVEGKVNESFGPTVKEWLPKEASAQKHRRFGTLLSTLGIDRSAAMALRYQLLHRTAAGIYEAHRYRAAVAVLMVHSFDPADTGAKDYQQFASALIGNGGGERLVRH